jgi:cyclophilin family peptidyl-prolyl cis-trans isomerase/HEAT repeat protein
MGWVAGAWLCVAGACATAPPAVVTPPVPPVPPLDQRIAWILRLEAQRWLVDPAVPAADLRLLVADGDPAVRRRAALAVGRVGMDEGVDALTPLLTDAESDVRGEAAFAIGLIGAPEAETTLRDVLADTDVLVRGRAAEGLGLLAVATPEPRDRWVASAELISTTFGDCGARIAPIAPDDEGAQTPEVAACRKALFALTRLGHYDSLARVALAADGRPASQWWPVAYALQRIGDPRAAAPLEHLLRSSGVYATAFALRGLAGRPAALPVAQRFAADTTADERLRVTAIRALGRAALPAATDTLLTLLAVRDVSTTLTLEVLSALAAGGDPRAFDVMVDRFTDKRPQVRAAALAAAARLNGDAFIAIISSLPADQDWSVRAAMATALGGLEPDRVRSALMALADDQDQRVRGPALTALVRVGAPSLDARVREALAAPDFMLRATAAGLIGRVDPAGAVAALVEAYDRGASDSTIAARVAALEAAADIGGDAARALIDRAARTDADWAVRLRAAVLSDGQSTATRPAALRHSVEFFESDAFLRPPFSPVALIETRLGVIEIELNVVEAPLTTRNFIDLAHAGFFNGLRIHRLVPNFVLQAGDPRGDGEGGPGYAIVDELSPLPFVRGTVGMALSSADTGGSQFFITHSPQPHLDGRYPVFGRVVRGMEVVDGLALGDVIERVRIWDGVTLK